MFFVLIGGFRSILKASVFHCSLTWGQKVNFFAMIGGLFL